MTDPVYLSGDRHPDDYIRTFSSSYGTEKQKKFAASLGDAPDGSVYLDKRLERSHRFSINFDGSVITVTHIKLKGKWKVYDPKGMDNLVIQVRAGSSPWEAHRVLEQAMHATKLGKALGYDAMRPLTDAIMQTLGLQDVDSWVASPEYLALKGSGDSEDLIASKLRALLEFAPPYGYPEELGEIGAEVDGVGYAENAAEYSKLLDGESDGFGGKGTGKPMPMLSEPVFYAVAGGKDAGRSFRARLCDLMEAVGLDYWDN